MKIRTHRTIIAALLFSVAMVAVTGCSKPDDGSGNDDTDNNDSNYNVVVPTGAINGLFSVDASRKVWFSKGNLQYKALTNTWRFAGNQWDYVGGDNFGTVYGSSNHLVSSTYDGWIDLFGWGTSGWKGGVLCCEPYSTSNEDYYYWCGGSFDNNLTGRYAKADWGVYNPISNGGNQAGLWRTLTIAEWRYIFESRNTSSGILYAMSRVNGVNGVILLPDNWNPSTYLLNNANQRARFASNTIDEASWNTILEPAGAVFLPAAGHRTGTEVVGFYGTQPQTSGYYWSSSYTMYNDPSDDTDAAHISIVQLDYLDYQSIIGWTDSNRSGGLSVRLVSDCQ